MKETVITLKEWQKASLYTLLCASASALVVFTGMKLGVLPSVLRLGGLIFFGKRLWLLSAAVFTLGCGWVLLMLGLNRDFRVKTAFIVLLPLMPFAYSRHALMTSGPSALAILIIYTAVFPITVSAIQLRNILLDASLDRSTRNAWAAEELFDLVHRDMLEGPVYYSLTVTVVMIAMPQVLRFTLFAEAALLGQAASEASSGLLWQGLML